MRIGIAGVGFVGGALKRWLEAYTDHELRLYDPGKGYDHSFRGTYYNDVDLGFICVPVPTKDDGTLDASLLEEAIGRFPTGIPLFIRSTILPDTLLEMKDVYPMPEFLNERSAFKDMERNAIIVGDRGKHHDILTKVFPGKEIMHCDPIEACIGKYGHNVHGAVKVNTSNIIYNLCKKHGVRYERVRQVMLMTGHVSEQGTLVPGPDGKLGYGGTCYPKDTKAFAHYTGSKMLHECVKENDEQKKTENT